MNGGPAFPMPAYADNYGDYIHPEPGMTLRDYFAAKAMPMHGAALSDSNMLPTQWHAEVARLSYATADAMLAAREKP